MFRPDLFTRPLHRRFSSASPAPPPPPAHKLPPSLRRYAKLFANKPVSYLTSFLILHELTAIIPVGGLFWYMHATSWTPPGIPQDLIEEKMASLRRWSERKGYGWFNGESGARVLLEVGTAYAVVKVLMPVRVAASVAAAPWFARKVVEPLRVVGARRWRALAVAAVGAAAVVGGGQYFASKQRAKEVVKEAANDA